MRWHPLSVPQCRMVNHANHVINRHDTGATRVDPFLQWWQPAERRGLGSARHGVAVSCDPALGMTLWTLNSQQLIPSIVWKYCGSWLVPCRWTS